MNFAIGELEELLGAEELVGAEELLGYDDDLAIGLTENQKRAIAQKLAMRNAQIVRQRQFDKSRKYLLGIESLAVGAGATATVLGRPQYPFKPYRMIVPSTIAPNFLLTQISIGQQPVFVATGGVPATAFSEVAWGSHVLWDTASIGNEVSVSAQNTSAGALDFRAALFGDVAR